MPNYWGKLAYNLRRVGGISSVGLSPIWLLNIRLQLLHRVQVELLHKVFPNHPLYISPDVTTTSPLSEHYLYPVSTEPIINPTKRI